MWSRKIIIVSEKLFQIYYKYWNFLFKGNREENKGITGSVWRDKKGNHAAADGKQILKGRSGK